MVKICGEEHKVYGVEISFTQFNQYAKMFQKRLSIQWLFILDKVILAKFYLICSEFQFVWVMHIDDMYLVLKCRTI